MYLSLEMQTLNIGDKVVKNQPVAFTKNFNKNGMYCSGKNVFMAVMNYVGMSHEDAYVITKELSSSMSRDIVKEVSIVVPPGVNVLKLEKEVGKNVTNEDSLVEFTYQRDIDDYLELSKLGNVDDDDIIGAFEKNQDEIKLPAQNGEIVDIKVFINNKNDIDKKIVVFHKSLVDETKRIMVELSKNAKTEDERLKSVDNLNLKFFKTSGHKLKGGIEFVGARIVYYIKQKRELEIGDKLATRYGKLCRNDK